MFSSLLVVRSHTWKSKARGDTRHGGRDQMIEIAIGRCCQFERAETNVIESLIVNTVCFIRVLDQLMNWERGIVRFNDSVRDLRWWNNRKCHHNAWKKRVNNHWLKKKTVEGFSLRSVRICKCKVFLFFAIQYISRGKFSIEVWKFDYFEERRARFFSLRVVLLPGKFRLKFQNKTCSRKMRSKKRSSCFLPPFEVQQYVNMFFPTSDRGVVLLQVKTSFRRVKKFLYQSKRHYLRSGYSSRIFEMRSVPMPEPVPPPKECVIWKPWRQSHDSASLRTTSRTESTSSAPSV